MVIIDTVINTLFGGLTLDPAGMHCPLWDDAFVSSPFVISLSEMYTDWRNYWFVFFTNR